MAGDVIGSGVVTAPGAGATIATIASGSLPAGRYRVSIVAGVSGTAVADLNNMELQRGGVDYVTPLPHGAGGEQGEFKIEEVELSGSQALDVKAIGAGTASIEYNATVTAVRTGPL